MFPGSCTFAAWRWCELEFVVQAAGVMFFSGAESVRIQRSECGAVDPNARLARRTGDRQRRKVSDAVRVNVGTPAMPRIASTESERHSTPPPMLNPKPSVTQLVLGAS